MSAIGSFEAKNRFSSLLERAERGEEIVITKRGRPVAKLVPFVPATRDSTAAQAAAERIIARAKAAKHGPFDWEEWKKYRDEGRP